MYKDIETERQTQRDIDHIKQRLLIRGEIALVAVNFDRGDQESGKDGGPQPSEELFPYDAGSRLARSVGFVGVGVIVGDAGRRK